MTNAEKKSPDGIDEAMIERLVRGFYSKVRDDALLGPVFASRIADWEPHLQTMCRFWSSVMLTSGTYKGQPLPKHVPLPIDKQHFAHWLELFEETARELFPEAVARQFVERAQRIGESLQLGIAVGRNMMLKRGEGLPVS